jgi:hypothetical protein
MSLPSRSINPPIDKSKAGAQTISASAFTSLVRGTASRTSAPAILQFRNIVSNFAAPVDSAVFTVLDRIITDKTLSIRWMNKGLEYDISYTSSAGNGAAQRYARGVTQLYLTELTPETIYTFTITPTTSTTPTIISYRTLQDSRTVNDLVISALSPSSVALSYTQPQLASGVQVYYSSPTESSDNVGLNSRSLFSLDPSITYTVYTRSIINNILGPESRRITFRTASIPAPLNSFTITNVGVRTARINYTKPPGVEYVKVYFKRTADTQYSNDLDLEDLFLLQPSTTYQVRLSLIIEGTEYSISNIKTFTTTAIPTIINDLVIRDATITYDTAILEYTKPQTAAWVNVYYKKAIDTIYTVGRDLTTLSQLMPLTSYNVYLTSVIEGDEYTPSNIATFTTKAPAEIVTNLRATDITNSVATIRYTHPPGATKSYIYFWRSIDARPNPAVPMAEPSVFAVDQSFRLQGLSPLTTYYISVRAVQGGQWWPMSGDIEFTTLANPNSIASFSVPVVSIYYALLQYTKPDDAVYVAVYFKRVEDTTFTMRENLTRMFPLLPSTNYEVYLRSVKLVNGIYEESPQSVTRSFRTLNVPPPVTNVEIGNITNNSATLAYSIPSGSGIEAVRVYYKKTTAPTYNMGLNLVSLTGLEPSTTYTFYIVSYAVFQEHGRTVEQTFTTLATDATITDLEVSEISYDSATLTYTRPSEATQVTVYYRPTQGTSGFTSLLNARRITGLQPQTAYTVFVAATVGTTEFPPTSLEYIKGFTTTSATGIVQDLEISNVTSSSATFTYTPPSGSTVVVYYKQSTDEAYSEGAGLLSLTNLVGSTTYYVYTRSTIGGVEGNMSPVKEFTTLVNPACLNNVAVTAVSTSQVYFSFSPLPANSVWIKAYWRRVPHDPTISAVTSTMIEAAFFNIQRRLFGFFSPGITYAVYFTVITRFNGNDIESPPSRTLKYTMSSEVSVVNDLIVSDVTHESARLSYSNLPTTQQIKVYYRRSTDTANTIGINLTSLTGLQPSTEYRVFVTSVTNSIESPPSITRTFRTIARPGAISDLSVSNITTNSATLNYTNISNGISVRVYYRVAGLGLSFTSATNLTSLVGLQSSTSYDVFVTSIGADDSESPPSGTETFQTLSSVGAITDLDVTNVTNNAATLSYTRPGGASVVVSYKRAATADSYTNVNNLLNMTGLAPSTQYQVFVTPVGSSFPSSLRTFQTLALPPSVTNFDLINATVNSFEVSCTKPADATAIRIYYRRVGATTYSIVTDGPIIYNLQPSTQYEAYVTAIKAEGESSPTGIDTISTLSIPAVITNLNITNVSYSSASLDYSIPARAGSVRVYYKKSTDLTFTSELGTTTLSGLQPSTEYKVYLASVTNGQEYSPSEERTFTTTAVPSTISNLTTTKVTTSSVTLSYPSPPGTAADINIYYKKSSETNFRRVTTKFKVLYGLSRATQYNVYCTFIISGVESAISTNTITFTTLNNAGSALGGLVINDLTAVGSTDDTISVSYTRPTNPTFSRYHTLLFYRKLGANTEFRSVINASTIYGLEPSTTYEVFAASKFIIENFSTLNDPSPVIEITTLPIFKVITDLAVNTLAYNSAILSYTRPTPATSVKVSYKRATDAVYTHGTNLTTLSGLQPSTTYNVYVTPVLGATEYSPSNILSFNTLEFPTVITDLVLKEVRHNVAKIDYTNLPNARDVRVYCKKRVDSTFSSGLNLKTLVGLDPSTIYDMYVTSIAQNNAESTGSAVQSFKTLASASTPPIVLLTPVDSSGSVTPFTTSVRYVIPKPLNIVSYDIEVTTPKS